MSTLFDCSQYAPRPQRDWPEVISSAASAQLKDFAEWDFSKEILEYALRLYDSDGYQRAKKLEKKFGIEPDAEMVSRLDDLSVERAHRAAVAEWVKRYDIKCPFQLGDRVTFASRGEDIWGEISRIDAEHAQITVFCESLGHVRKGLWTHGLIVNYEDAKPFGERPIEPAQAAVVVSPNKKGNGVE